MAAENGYDWMAHGGAIDAAAAHFGVPRGDWLDLSTGINPHAYTVPELAPEYWHRLPDRDLLTWLAEAAAACYGVPDSTSVLPAPGSQAVIQALPHLLTPQHVAVVGPTYGEHRASWLAAGHRVSDVRSLDEVSDEVTAIVIVNPNNPDGRTVAAARILDLAARRLVIVDEAFADVSPETSVAREAGRQASLVVLRSVGKFFGLAGMRLGFAIAAPPLRRSLAAALGPWPVSGPAAAVGAVALSDGRWIRATRVRLAATAGRLDGMLMRCGLRVAGGTSLFRLVETPRAAAVFETLGRSGILVRRFAFEGTWLRFGLPADDHQFERLETVLAPTAGRGPPPQASAAAVPGR